MVGIRIRILAVVDRNSGDGVVVGVLERKPPLPSKEFGKTEANVVEMTSGTEVDGVTFWVIEVEGRGVFACNGSAGARYSNSNFKSLLAVALLNKVTLVVEDLGWVDLYFDIPISARFCWGQ